MFSVTYIKALQMISRFNTGLLERCELSAINIHAKGLCIFTKKDCELREHFTKTERPVIYLVSAELLAEAQKQKRVDEQIWIDYLSFVDAEKVIYSMIYERYQIGKMEYGKREIVFCARLFKLGEKYLDSQPNAKECENALPFEMMKDARYKFSSMYVAVWKSIIEDLTGIKFL